MKNVYFVILAGGSGERLWPLSRLACPKQLIPFLNSTSLLEQTLDRISSLVISKEHVIVVTNKMYQNAIERLVGNRVGIIIAEDAARNTAPAILMACYHIAQKDEHASVVILPSDAYIPDHHAFCAVLEDGLTYITQCDDVVVFGLKPTYAATGYGYVQANLRQLVGNGNGYRIVKFHEKPDKNLAQMYVQHGDMWWNIGIFAASLATFMREFKVHAPEVDAAVCRYLSGQGAYADVPSISVDYAVMEKSSHIVVFPALFEWSDVGNLNVFLSLQAQHSSQTFPVVNFDGMGNLASTKKLVVCVGVSDLCIVETDDVILVAQKHTAENVKKVLPLVKAVREASL